MNKSNLCLITACIALTSTNVFGVTFSFLDGSTWQDSGGSTTTDFPAPVAPRANPTDVISASQTMGGVTMTVNSTLIGTALDATRNLNDETGVNNPGGFNFATYQSNNDIVITASGTTPVVNVLGPLLNYQRIDFVFSQDIILDDFTIDDIDNDGRNRSVSSFWDFVGAEAFTGVVGAAGTGISPDFTLGTRISEHSIDTSGTDTLDFITNTRNRGDDNPNSSPSVQASMDFGTTPIRAISLYTFTMRDPNLTYTTGAGLVDFIVLEDMSSDPEQNPHRVAFGTGTIEVTPVPEPSGALLTMLGTFTLLFSRKRR